jgi:hypothetical protein
MITKILLSYVLLIVLTIFVGVFIRMSDIEIPEWLKIFLGLLIFLFPFLLSANVLYFIWV